MKALIALVYVMFLGNLLFVSSCAHVVPTAKACAASSVQVDQVFGVLNNPEQAKAIAAVDALGFLACATRSAVDEIIAALSPNPDGGLTVAETENSPVLANALAWRAAHP